MKKIILLMALAFSAYTLASFGRKNFHSSLISLASANKAKQMCSCLFVMQQGHPFCDRYSIPDKYLDWVDSTAVDSDQKVVQATVAFFWESSAKYISEKKGCQLQSL